MGANIFQGLGHLITSITTFGSQHDETGLHGEKNVVSNFHVTSAAFLFDWILLWTIIFFYIINNLLLELEVILFIIRGRFSDFNISFNIETIIIDLSLLFLIDIIDFTFILGFILPFILKPYELFEFFIVIGSILFYFLTFIEPLRFFDFFFGSIIFNFLTPL